VNQSIGISSAVRTNRIGSDVNGRRASRHTTFREFLACRRAERQQRHGPRLCGPGARSFACRPNPLRRFVGRGGCPFTYRRATGPPGLGSGPRLPNVSAETANRFAVVLATVGSSADDCGRPAIGSAHRPQVVESGDLGRRVASAEITRQPRAAAMTRVASTRRRLLPHMLKPIGGRPHGC